MHLRWMTQFCFLNVCSLFICPRSFYDHRPFTDTPPLGCYRWAEAGGKLSGCRAFVWRHRRRLWCCEYSKGFALVRSDVWVLKCHLLVSQASGDFGSGDGSRREIGGKVKVSQPIGEQYCSKIFVIWWTVSKRVEELNRFDRLIFYHQTTPASIRPVPEPPLIASKGSRLKETGHFSLFANQISGEMPPPVDTVAPLQLFKLWGCERNYSVRWRLLTR